MAVENDIRNIFDSIDKKLRRPVSKAEMAKIGKQAIKIIVRRTRLGNIAVRSGEKNFAKKQRLNKRRRPYKASFAEQYDLIRKRRKDELSNQTSPGKRNLTLTGQMLDSMKNLDVNYTSVVIGPSGNRRDGMSNDYLAGVLEDRGFIFNDLTELEIRQIVRFFRKYLGEIP